jgi:hypothetical protein
MDTPASGADSARQTRKSTSGMSIFRKCAEGLDDSLRSRRALAFSADLVVALVGVDDS